MPMVMSPTFIASLTAPRKRSITTAFEWELTEGIFTRHLRFRCGLCGHLHRKHRELIFTKMPGFQQRAVTGQCDGCGSYNLLRLKEDLYLSASLS